MLFSSLSPVFLVLLVLNTSIALVFAQQNVTLQSTAPQIVYSPSLCSNSTTGSCVSAWQVLNDIPGTSVVSTTGPVPQAGNIIPQMFLSFIGSAAYIYTSSLSTAIINVTLTAYPSEEFITHQIDSSIDLIIVLNIPDTQTTTLSATYIPTTTPSRFDVDFIMITTATNASSTSSIFPSISLSPSSSPPSLSPSSTSIASPQKSTKQTAAAIAGESLGAILGLITVLLAGFLIYRYRRRKQRSQRLS